MDNKEQENGTNNEEGLRLSPEELADLQKNTAQEQKNRANEAEANNTERGAEKETTQLEQEAREQAVEKPSAEAEKAPDTSRERRAEGPVSKSKRNQAYKEVMSETRAHLSPAGRSFSKVIHNPAVEKTSEVVGKTIARPNAILAGSVSAFILSLGIYLIARYFGYPLSGTETIAAFVLGWIVGVIYDYARIMLTGGRV